ncbi:hypothetical protein [Thalassospira profundimaris]|uniref:hypothetical protein n=1 Tax=Thalassospira profundimaris TaxID=502049 RepID=UPI000DEDEF04|nr:hypothetical protein [Thalassospira profundimaris]
MKSCFVISPIGEEGSDTRNRANKVLKHIIRPAAEACGYEAQRADEIDKPGLITSQVIERVISDQLVIADLTETNPNVFYELALRHATGKPLVQIIQKGERIPFDVAGTRTIHVDHQDLDSAAAAKESIERQIREIEADPGNIETPLSTTIDLQMLRSSGDPEDRSFAEIISEISELRSAINTISTNGDDAAFTRRALRDIRERIDYLAGEDLGNYKSSGLLPRRADHIISIIEREDIELVMLTVIGLATKFVPELTLPLEQFYTSVVRRSLKTDSSRARGELKKLTGAVVLFVLEWPERQPLSGRPSFLREAFDRFLSRLHNHFM